MPATHCPTCGAPLPSHSSNTHCPRCLLLQGLDSGVSKADQTSNNPTNDLLRPGWVLDTIGATIGGVPRVMLRDTAFGEEPSPIIRPTNGDESSTRYRIDGEIARGGMGQVLRGRDPDLGRDVALKVLREDMQSNADMVRRFVEEAQIGGQLQHPGIVPIYELGALSDKRPFFAMKLVKGDTLAKLLEARKSPADGLPKFLSIFEAIVQTVAYAHARGVIHRDLKPSNVMVGSFGEVQVMDWGLAKVLPRGGVADDASAGKVEPQETVIATARSGSDDSDLSHAGSVMGTPSYMAPEQARGEIDKIDERADVFALGSILCEILTGDPAFTGRTSGEIQRKAAVGDLSDAVARVVQSGADPDLIAIAKDCLSREPEDRPRSAGEMTERVTAYLTGVQEKLKTSERERAVAEARAEEERKQRRLQVGLAASVLALVALGGCGYVWTQQQKAERIAKTARGVDEALAEAARLQGEAQAALAEDLSRWEVALSAVKRAEGLLAQGEADATLIARVSALFVQLERERAAAVEKARLAESDRRLLERLDAVRANRIENRDSSALQKKFVDAFAAFGYDVEKMEPAAAAASLGGRAASVEIAAAIDDWVDAQRAASLNKASWTHLVAVANSVDPDPFRRKLRSIAIKPDPDALRRLAAEATDHPDLPAATFVRLAHSLPRGGKNERLNVLRAGRQRHPSDFTLNDRLAAASLSDTNAQKEDQEDALRFATAAVAIRPRSSVAHNNLGVAMSRTSNTGARRDEIIVEYREAIRLDPELAVAHANLGYVLANPDQRRPEAITAWKEALRLDPSAGQIWYELGKSLVRSGEFEAGVDALRHAQVLVPSGGLTGGIQPVLDPSLDLAKAESYVLLKRRLPGVLRGDDKPSPAERIEFARMCFNLELYATATRFAMQAYAEAPELLENVPVGRRYYLGVLASARAGCGEGKDDPAPSEEERAQFREQSRLWFQDELAKWKRQFAAGPMSTKMHVRDLLSVARKNSMSLQGFIDPARVAKLPATEQAAWRKIWDEVDTLLTEWQTLGSNIHGAIAAELEQRLPAILRNEERPTTQADRRRVAASCYRRGLYLASVKFYDELLKNDPVLNDRPASRDRYNAACSAALAGCGQGKDEPPPGNDEKARLRQQALGWMRVELAAHKRALEKGLGPNRPAFIKELQHWQEDTDLAGVRDPESLARLSADERPMWQALWDEVASLLKAVQDGPS